MDRNERLLEEEVKIRENFGKKLISNKELRRLAYLVKRRRIRKIKLTWENEI